MEGGFVEYLYSSSFVETEEDGDDACTIDPNVTAFSTSYFTDFAIRREPGIPHDGCVNVSKGTEFGG